MLTRIGEMSRPRRSRSGREPRYTTGRASTGLSTARTARCAALVRTVVSALGAKSAVGLHSVSMVANALDARSAVGHHSASTVVSAVSARSAVGREYASTVVYALGARSAAGDQSASTVVSATTARSAVGREYASTVVIALIARSATRRNSRPYSCLNRSPIRGCGAAPSVCYLRRYNRKQYQRC